MMSLLSSFQHLCYQSFVPFRGRPTMARRRATHAGSWYSSDGPELDGQLSQWLNQVNPSDDYSPPVETCKAVVAPHAGYSYSGPAAAWAYKGINITGIKRVFVLGPSHHVYLDGCALSRCTDYDTPVGNLPIDTKTTDELRATGKFEDMSIETDEDEHSIEMHLPYVRKIFEGQDIEVVPILVGAINQESEAAYGRILAPYLASPDTFFVVSSDFCHWGTRFRYTFYYPEPLPSEAPVSNLGNRGPYPKVAHPIHESIRALDHEGMNILALPAASGTATKAHSDFAAYLSRTKNTICGRHPIGVLLGSLAELERSQGIKPALKWVRYEQSSSCETIKDSSVSYASAVVMF